MKQTKKEKRRKRIGGGVEANRNWFCSLVVSHSRSEEGKRERERRGARGV